MWNFNENKTRFEYIHNKSTILFFTNDEKKTIDKETAKIILLELDSNGNPPRWECGMIRDMYGMKLLFPWKDGIGLNMYYYCPGQMNDKDIVKLVQTAIGEL